MFLFAKNKKSPCGEDYFQVLIPQGDSFLGKRELAEESFLFVPEKEAKRARRSDAAAAGWGCGPRPRDAAT